MPSCPRQSDRGGHAPPSHSSDDDSAPGGTPRAPREPRDDRAPATHLDSQLPPPPAHPSVSQGLPAAPQRFKPFGKPPTYAGSDSIVGFFRMFECWCGAGVLTDRDMVA